MSDSLLRFREEEMRMAVEARDRGVHLAERIHRHERTLHETEHDHARIRARERLLDRLADEKRRVLDGDVFIVKDVPVQRRSRRGGLPAKEPSIRHVPASRAKRPTGPPIQTVLNENEADDDLERIYR